jgi:hypothetical protein
MGTRSQSLKILSSLSYRGKTIFKADHLKEPTPRSVEREKEIEKLGD